MVRIIDVPVKAGDLTEDADHADRIDRLFTEAGPESGQYGHAVQWK